MLLKQTYIALPCGKRIPWICCQALFLKYAGLDHSTNGLDLLAG